MAFLYGHQESDRLFLLLEERLEYFKQQHPEFLTKPCANLLTEQDIILITYGDQIQEPGRKPLQTLGEFLDIYLKDTIRNVHILPFFPSSSDDGFSVIDYRQVNPALGDWHDVWNMSQQYRLMFDAVINHISRKSEWFQAFLNADKQHTDYFIHVDPSVDLSGVTRPRALPLLTHVETIDGSRHVWTTFSEDQIDLNYAEPKVLYEIIDLLLFYIEHGAEIIRLDAIAYLWKEIGTSCIHLPQTHAIVKLFRAVLDSVAPHVILITETNVPHDENIRYFGEGFRDAESKADQIRGDEAQMVYQFPLAPLVLHTFFTCDACVLMDWADSLVTPFSSAAFFNFTASHDGIGVRPAEGLLSTGDFQTLVDRTLAHDGHVSYRSKPDGTKSPYELNITFFDALNDPLKPEPDLDVRRFLASQAIMLSLAGVPGIYFHSLFGSRNCHTCVEETGRARSINREKFQLNSLLNELNDPENLTTKVFMGYLKLLKIRKEQPAFHPHGAQRILHLRPDIFSLIRTSTDRKQNVVSLINVSPKPIKLALDCQVLELPLNRSWKDLLSGKIYTPNRNHLKMYLKPYQVLWLKP